MTERKSVWALIDEGNRWLLRLQHRVKGVEMYGPRDAGNPMAGSWTIVGPLSEQRHSEKGIEHAALLYLAQVCRDDEAKVELQRRMG